MCAKQQRYELNTIKLLNNDFVEHCRGNLNKTIIALLEFALSALATDHGLLELRGFPQAAFRIEPSCEGLMIQPDFIHCRISVARKEFVLTNTDIVDHELRKIKVRFD